MEVLKGMKGAKLTTIRTRAFAFNEFDSSAERLASRRVGDPRCTHWSDRLIIAEAQ